MSGAPIFAPWFANEQETYYSVHASDPEAPPMGNLVCKLPLTGQGIARARLIAAAPELLEALRNAEASLHHCAIPDVDRETLGQVRAAIAKATGAA